MKRIVKSGFFIVAICSIVMIQDPSDFVSTYTSFVFDHIW